VFGTVINCQLLATKRGAASFFSLPLGRVETTRDTAICWHGRMKVSGTVYLYRLKQSDAHAPENEAIVSPVCQKESQSYSEWLNNAFVWH
jgi:hypothetical protein